MGHPTMQENDTAKLTPTRMSTIFVVVLSGQKETFSMKYRLSLRLFPKSGLSRR